MSNAVYRSYNEYPVIIGNAMLLFFTDSGTLLEYMPTTSEMHSHEYCEIFYVTKGKMEITTARGSYILKESDAAIVPPGLRHSTKTTGDTQRTAISLICTKAKARDSGNYYKSIKELISGSVVTLPSFQGADAFTRLSRYYYCNLAEKNELVKACLHEIIILMKEYSGGAESTGDGILSDSTLYRSYIIEHYLSSSYRSASLGELAELMHLSTQQTHRIFKSLYGMSFVKKLLEIRMKKAEALIKDTDLSFGKISEKLGYKCPHSFFSAFREHSGLTPGQYRSLHSTHPYSL